MDTLLQDLRYAVRQLAQSPGFTAVAVVTLALGIGANTAIFSAVDAVLLRPLPYPQSDRLIEVLSTGFQGSRFGVSYPDLLDLRRLKRDFTGVAAYSTQRYNLTGAGDPREVEAALVTADLFDVLGARPEIGRVFTAGEERTPVALLSHALWVTHFGSDRGLLGKGITLDGASYTVIGVMPGGFHFPDDEIQIWTPIGGILAQERMAETYRMFHAFNTVARLAPGATLPRVRSDLDLLARRLAASDSGSGEKRVVAFGGRGPGGPTGPRAGGPPSKGFMNNGFVASSLRDEAIGDVRRPLFIMLGAVGLVLLIACANAANLLLARAAARRREMAIRQALGAARGRLVRQLLTESLLLALAGGVVGIALSVWGLDAILSIWPEALPHTAEIGLDHRVLLFTTSLTVLTGLSFGLMPARRASAPGIEEVLRDDTAGATGGGAGWRRLQSPLVVGEVALALVLLIGAGLLVRSFIRLNAVNPGYETRDVLAARVRLTPARYPAGPQQAQFFSEVLAAVQARPGVAAAGFTVNLPLSGQARVMAFDPRRVRPDDPEPILMVHEAAVSPNYFATLRIPIRRGRDFAPEDRAGAQPVAIVNRALADRLWPGQDPIGKQFPVFGPRGGGGGGAPITIVGLIDNLRSAALTEAAGRPEMYLSTLQERELPEMWLAVRASDGAPLKLAGAIRDAVHRADPEQPIGEIVSLEQMIRRQTAARRFNTSLLTLFALLAVGLALVGIYGVTSYAVTQRTREIGIRMALGARPGEVVRLLLGESLKRVLIGVGLGLLGAFGATRTLTAMLFEVAPSDAATFAATAVLLVAVALMATWIAARRATDVDPLVALRYE